MQAGSSQDGSTHRAAGSAPVAAADAGSQCRSVPDMATRAQAARAALVVAAVPAFVAGEALVATIGKARDELAAGGRRGDAMTRRVLPPGGGGGGGGGGPPPVGGPHRGS